MGNGLYGSSKVENLHALRCIVKRTPESCLRLIRVVGVEMWLLESGWDRSGKFFPCFCVFTILFLFGIEIGIGIDADRLIDWGR